MTTAISAAHAPGRPAGAVRLLITNMLAFAASELAQRVTRVLTTIVVARVLTAADLGIAAMAITCFELVRVLANNGIAQAVVRAEPARLAATTATAWRLSWLICLVMAALQVAAGFVIAQQSGRGDVLAMIACLAGVYLVMPFGLVQVYLLQRANRLGSIAAIATAQSIADNILTVLLAASGFGAWAIVLPKLLTVPIWAIGMRRAIAWTPDRSQGFVPAGELTAFALPVLGSEILSALRLNLDKVLVGALLGIEALGLYTFIVNAGIGLSLSLTTALSASLYPHLASLAGRPAEMLRRFDTSLLWTALPVGAIIAVQTGLASTYVPIVFGAHWAHAASLVAVLCASAVTKPLYDATVQLLRACGRTDIEFAGALLLTGLVLASLAAGLTQGLSTGIEAFAITAAAVQLLLALAGRSIVAAQARRDTGAEAGKLAVAP